MPVFRCFFLEQNISDDDFYRLSEAEISDLMDNDEIEVADFFDHYNPYKNTLFPP